MTPPSPLRVLHVISAVSWRYGGTTAALLPMCDALAREPGVEVEIAATDADGPGQRLDAPPTCAARIHLFPRRPPERLKRSPELARWVADQAGRFDVVHVHGLWTLATTAAAQGARRNRRPLVVSPHGMMSLYTWSRSPAMKAVFWRLLERGNVNSAACLHLTSKQEGAELAGLGLRPPLRYVGLGVADDAWTTPRDPDWLRARLGPAAVGRPVVLFLSRLHPKKGVADYLLPAFRDLPGGPMLAVCGGPDETAPAYADEIRARAAALGIADRVHLLGPVAPADRWKAFDGADVFALPSMQENFGLVIAEAMARGCPVVASTDAGACDHLLAAGAGLPVRREVGEITAALAKLLADPAARSEMGARGRAYAAAHLTWGQVASEIVAMYRDCLREAPR